MFAECSCIAKLRRRVCDVIYIINQSTPKQISMVVSYTTVGITDYINLRNMNKAYIGLISAPFYLALSKNAFIVVE